MRVQLLAALGLLRVRMLAEVRLLEQLGLGVLEVAEQPTHHLDQPLVARAETRPALVGAARAPQRQGQGGRGLAGLGGGGGGLGGRDEAPALAVGAGRVRVRVLALVLAGFVRAHLALEPAALLHHARQAQRVRSAARSRIGRVSRRRRRQRRRRHRLGGAAGLGRGGGGRGLGLRVCRRRCNGRMRRGRGRRHGALQPSPRAKLEELNLAIEVHDVIARRVTPGEVGWRHRCHALKSVRLGRAWEVRLDEVVELSVQLTQRDTVRAVSGWQAGDEWSAARQRGCSRFQCACRDHFA